ncbi:hypothetical protein [Caminibacter pacificus]
MNFKKIIVLFVASVSISSAFLITTPSKKAFKSDSGMQIGVEIKNVKFDNTNIDGTIYGLKIGFEHSFGQSNFGIKWGFFADYGNINSVNVTEGGFFLAPKYNINISEKTNLSIYGGVQGKYVGLESSDGYGFVPYGGIELFYGKWSVAVEYSKGSITFESGDLDEETLSGSINYKF